MNTNDCTCYFCINSLSIIIKGVHYFLSQNTRNESEAVSRAIIYCTFMPQNHKHQVINFESCQKAIIFSSMTYRIKESPHLWCVLMDGHPIFWMVDAGVANCIFLTIYLERDRLTPSVLQIWWQDIFIFPENLLVIFASCEPLNVFSILNLNVAMKIWISKVRKMFEHLSFFFFFFFTWQPRPSRKG